MSVRDLLASARQQVAVAGAAKARTGGDTDEESDDEGVSLRFENRNLVSVPFELVDSLAQQALGVAKLSLKSNMLTRLPPLGALDQLFYLDISHNRFEEFPLAVADLPSLEILDMSHNRIRVIPREAARLTSLKVFSLTDNLMQYVPPVLADFVSLTFLELDRNPLIMPGPEFLSGSSEHDWVAKLRLYIQEHRAVLDQALSTYEPPTTLPPPRGSERERAASTSDVNSSRATKRMGFVMRKSTVGAAGAHPHVHARGFSTGHVGSRLGSFDSHVSQSSTEYNSGVSEGGSFGSSVPRDELQVHEELAITGQAAGTGTAISTVGNGKAVPALSGKLESLSSPVIVSPADFSPKTPDTAAYGRADDRGGISASPDALGIRNRRLEEQLGHPGTVTDNYVGFGTPPKALTGGSPQALLLSPGADHNSAAYLKRLSTLQEEETIDDIAVQPEVSIRPVRKIMFSLYEFHGVVRRCLALLQDGKATHKLAAVITASRNNLHDLVEVFENSKFTNQRVRFMCSRAVSAVEELVRLLLSTEIFDAIRRGLDVTMLRSLMMQTFLSFNELRNAWSDLSSGPDRATVENSADFAAADEQLCQQLRSATRSSKAVLSLLNDTIALSAQASAESGDPRQAQPPHAAIGISAPPVSHSVLSISSSGQWNSVLAAKVRDLSNSCIAGVAATRRLNTDLDQRAEKGTIEPRKFWEDVNNFLKSIISILGAARAAMSDLPLLADVGADISSLARVTKEIPPLLEASSYKMAMQDEISPRRASGSAGTSNNAPAGTQLPAGISPNLTLALPTPLTATLGAAAQAVVSPGYVQSPFFHDYKPERQGD